MDRNAIVPNMLMFIRMSSNEFYPFSTVYPGSGYRTVEKQGFSTVRLFLPFLNNTEGNVLE